MSNRLQLVDDEVVPTEVSGRSGYTCAEMSSKWITFAGGGGGGGESLVILGDDLLSHLASVEMLPILQEQKVLMVRCPGDDLTI